MEVTEEMEALAFPLLVLHLILEVTQEWVQQSIPNLHSLMTSNLENLRQIKVIFKMYNSIS